MREQSRIVFKSIFRMKVNDRVSGRLVGYVGDISASGMRLLSDELIETGEVMHWRLRMRNSDGSTTLIDVDGKILWSRMNAQSGYVESGIHIEQPSKEFTRLIKGFSAKRGGA